MAARPPSPLPAKNTSAFTELGLQQTVGLLKQEIQDLYRADNTPWIIGYSGGKDSTATLQLVWLALQDMTETDRKKTVHVISTDTLVENPVVAMWVIGSLERISTQARTCALPIETHRLTPNTHETFWVNLLGRGYPSPRQQFRWCTERLKIRPSNRFINEIVRLHGEAVLLLGARSAESSARATRLNSYRSSRGALLTQNATLPNCHVYTPIKDWSNDDVWQFLMMFENPWGHSNKALMSMYAGASAGGECPIVVDTSTPSCGASRFGCWVCTLVEEDKSMTAMVRNDEDLEWLRPLLSIRSAIDPRERKQDGKGCRMKDGPLRDFRRMTGSVVLNRDNSGDHVPGPLKQEVRCNWLMQLLMAQCEMRERAPEAMRSVDIITTPELEEIRRIWVMEKHEIEDTLPGIYEEATGERYPGRRLDDNLVLGRQEMDDLQALCGEDRLQYELIRELLSLERQERTRRRRAGLYTRIERAFQKHFYENKEDAVAYARARAAARADGLTASTGRVAEDGEDIL